MDAPSRSLIFDPFAGAAGDMILAGLIDLGLSEDWLSDLLADLSLEVNAISVGREQRGALHACILKVEFSASVERRLDDLLEIVEKADLPTSARDMASQAFRRLAEVEAEIHGVPIDQVHFHEVGGADSILDIIGVAAAVSELGIDGSFMRPIPVGHGWVDTAHGRLPLPAPATLKLLEGLPVLDSRLEGELTTPTGALLLSVFTGGRSPPAVFRPLRSGFGAGQRNPTSHPNCIRIILAETRPPRSTLYVLATDIDDMSPEHVPSVVEALRNAGALDVWTYPVQMKKGRTGVRLEALVPGETRLQASEALFAASSTLGVRYWSVDRDELPRSSETIEWQGTQVRIKTSRLPGGHVRRKPEYDDVLRAAHESGLPVTIVWQALMRQLDREL